LHKRIGTDVLASRGKEEKAPKIDNGTPRTPRGRLDQNAERKKPLPIPPSPRQVKTPKPLPKPPSSPRSGSQEKSQD
jgi:hypothetical protein